MLKWPGQVVIAGCQTFWTTVVSQAISDHDLDNLYQNLLEQVKKDTMIVLYMCTYMHSYTVCLVGWFSGPGAWKIDENCSNDVVSTYCNWGQLSYMITCTLIRTYCMIGNIGVELYLVVDKLSLHCQFLICQH